MRDLLVATLSDAGVEPRVDEDGNVLASVGQGGPLEEGPEEGTHLVLNTHIDTVPPHIPYERDGDTVRGRGACDAKGPLAAFLDAFLAVDPDESRLTLAITPDEETTQTGADALSGRLSADGYVVGEPTDLDVCVAARGQFEGEVTIRGESGHASDPGNGANAIRATAPVLQAMESYDETRGPGAHELLGEPTLTPTLVEGGEAANQIPGQCTITFDRRSVPPEDSTAFMADLEAHLADWLPAPFSVSVGLARPGMPHPDAFATDEGAELVRALAAESGGEIRPFGAATEASYFAADAPTVVFGPGVLADEEGPVAHSQREYVSLSAVERAGEILTRTLEELLS
jgi:acetylornithine deacetylase/succinyl-diaminopimelate desuccinylase